MKEENTTPALPPLVLSSQSGKASILSRLRRLRFMRAKAHLFRNLIKLRLPTSMVPLLKSILSGIPQDKPLAILTGVDDEANAHLVYTSKTETGKTFICHPLLRTYITHHCSPRYNTRLHTLLINHSLGTHAHTYHPQLALSIIISFLLSHKYCL